MNVATAGALAHPVSTPATTDEANLETGNRHITISDLIVSVKDTHIEGTNLPTKSIDEASYTIEETSLSTDGFTVTFQGQTHRIGAVTVTVTDVGVRLQNISISDGTSES
ncbi:hypothetical protein [Halorussus salinus]|uniref:hypothetical protein n=1 Tax=Halorussus salinus TaxID=1364935 RepID=UPI0010932CA4|nr:hypothetical protein [Halorussus salinus]